MAFIYVNHSLLVVKLRDLCFACFALGWLSSYLDNGREVVRDLTNVAVSSEKPVISGVPRGSVLGSLLFSIYLIHFDKIDEHCKYNFYADNLFTNLPTKLENISDTFCKINEPS